MMIKLTQYVSMRIILTLIIGFFPIISSASGIVIIGNKSITVDSITIKQAKKLWLGKLKRLGSAKVTVVDQNEGTKSYELFYEIIVKKNSSQLKAYWAKKTFTGKDFPPKKIKDDNEVLKWVADTPGGLGYVDSASVNSTVKSLLTSK